MGTATPAGAVFLRAPSSYPDKIVRQKAELVQNFALFADIPPEDCEAIVALARTLHFARGQTISLEGDHVRRTILLTSGCLKLSQAGPHGQEVIVRVVAPGENFSTDSLPKSLDCSKAVAVEPSAALVWEAKQFEVAAERFPVFRRNISHALLQLLNQMEVRFREVSTEKVAPRLSSQLVRLSSQVGKASDGHVEVSFSRQDLAQLTGTTLFTVSRLLGQWEDQGIVKPGRGKVLILNVAALVGLSQSE